MPTVPVRQDLLFRRIGKNFSEEEFDDFTFDFGLEIDDKVKLSEMEETAQEEESKKDSKVSEEDDPTVFKFDVAANRYDLLCLEGIGRSPSLKISLSLSLSHTHTHTHTHIHRSSVECVLQLSQDQGSGVHDDETQVHDDGEKIDVQNSTLRGVCGTQRHRVR